MDLPGRLVAGVDPREIERRVVEKVKYSGSKASPAVAFTRIALSSEISSASRKRARAPCIEPEASNT